MKDINSPNDSVQPDSTDKNISAYKVTISILFGLLGFGVNFFTIKFAFPPYTAVVLIGLLFPMLITLAWGWKYGLLAALAGGCQSMWWLWGPSNGYATFFVVPPFTLWIVWHGLAAGWRKKQTVPKWWLSTYAVEIPFRILSTINLFTLSRWAITLNPPPWSWASGAPNTIPMPFSNFVVIKQAAVGYVILLLADVLLNLGFVRKFFGLEDEYDQTNTNYIISASLLIGVFVWLVDSVIGYLVFHTEDSFLDLLALNTHPHDVFMRTMFILSCLMGGLLTSHLLRSQRESDQSLCESEEHYHNLFESVPIALVETDLSDVKKYIDELRGQGVTNLRDYFDERPEAVQNCAALVRFVDANPLSLKGSEMANKADLLENYDFGSETQSLTMFKEELIAFAGGASVHEIEMPFVSPSGKMKYDIKRVSIPPAFAETWSRAVVSFTDITGRVQAEAALLESEERFRAIFETAQDSIFIKDRTLKYTQVNPAMERLFGLPASKLIGRTDNDLFPGEAASLIREVDSRVLGGEIIEEEHTKSVKGVPHTFHTITVPMCDKSGEIIELCGIARDVTERVRADEALRESERQLQTLIDAMPDFVCFKDEDGRWLKANDASIRIFQLEGIDYQGKKDSELAELDSHLQGTFLTCKETDARAWKDGVLLRGEETIPNPDGSVRVYDVIKVPVFHPGGKRKGLVVLGHDITERKQARESLLKRTQEIELLYQASKQISQTLELDAVYWHLYDLVSSVMACDTLVVSSFDPDKKLIRCVFAINEGNPLDVGKLPPIPLNPEGQGTQSVVIYSGEALLIRDYEAQIKTSQKAYHVNKNGRVVNYDKVPETEDTTSSALIVPMKLEGQVTGVIQVMSYRLDNYSESDLRIIESLASQIAVAGDNAFLYQQAQRRYRELALLNRVIAAASTTLEPKAVLETTCRELALAFDLPQAAAALLNEERTASIVVAEYLAEGRSSALDVVIPLEDNPATQYVVEHKTPLAIVDAQHDPRMAAIHDVMRQRDTVSMLILPLMARGQVIGTLGLDAVERREFSRDEIDLAANAAAAAAQALENARLYQAEQRRRSEAELLREAARAVSTSLEIEEILRLILTQLNRALVFTAASVLILRENNMPELVVGSGYADETLTSQESQDLLRSSPILRQMARDLQPVVSADVRELEGWVFVPGAEHIRAWLGIPLVVRSRMIGALMMDSDQPDFFGEAEVQITQALAQLAAQAIENARLFSEAKRRLERLEALHTIDKAISTSFDLNMTASVFLDQVLTHLDVAAADVLIFDPFMQTLECIGRKGFRTSALQHTHLRLGQGLAGQVALQREMKYIPDLQEAEAVFLASPELVGEEFVSYYGVPLVAKGVLKGVLEIFHRTPLSADDEWLMFLNALAGQAAIAIDNASMFTDLQRSNLELGLAYDSTLEGWARALELRDMETEGHSRRVTEMTMRLAKAMGISGEALGHLRRGALLHDIGKMGVPDSILFKSGKLDRGEWAIMRQHTTWAYKMLLPIAYLRLALDIPRYHHEKWDGSGYPEGLRGEKIPLAARIFAIVDVWDALNSDRPYRKAWPEEKVIEYIRGQSGKHFDPKVTAAFLDMSGKTIPGPRSST